MSKSPEELCQERLKRVKDAVALKVPDRVPVTAFFAYFAASYSGITYEEYTYDPEKMLKAAIKVHEDFEPDLADIPSIYYLGPTLDAVGFKQLRWPGRHLSANKPYQFVEGEYMKADEYGHFLDDPTDWLIRKYWPRICTEFEPFSQIAPLKYSFTYFNMGSLAPFGTPGLQQALSALKNVGEAALQALNYTVKFSEEMGKRGFPLSLGGLTQAPYDTLGDYFRGTRGIMMDMYRRPDELLKALDKLTPWMIEQGVNAGKQSGNPFIFIPLHKGSDKFMNQRQFETFYWPTLKELMLGLIKEGMTPIVFVEADHTSRLETMKDVPPGKVVYHMENTDMFKAKEILGDRVCLKGNVPVSLLCLGTPDEIKDYCKKLIDVVGKDGGFILDSSVNVEEAKVENVRAMFDFTKEYGRY
ncbi:Uroporphyrinogen decarboxylase [Acididesulfobacillus acetoxydans]|uniref:Uroporphyrinogen decarboxylase n=1 Tax=Acididesulfobacillus acetoxydans TaxID=1561005 RepID=A0A8S0WF84_9FIRM|nr:uroporphyrinogen decarboxylase family protein [Acididesulfobacillus acetoxydans]CAA7600772.1 Uroporphyrinogen decarboxylase [Acididesulfobacillus acetoxydans]CEJ08620.1 Uroporphyrinogen-III decarboxylase [Acididesulfobacillus acetoxydans]